MLFVIIEVIFLANTNMGCNGGSGVGTFYRQTSDARLKDDDGPLVSLNLSLIPPS